MAHGCDRMIHDTFCSEANSSDAIDREPRCIAFMKGALVGGKKRAIVRCSIADGQSIPK